MLTTVLVGSSQTFVYEGYMVTPRGYTNKYTWDGEALPRPDPRPQPGRLAPSDLASRPDAEEHP